LQQIRNSFKQIAFVWADALCISQGTAREALGERGSEVAMMDNIYSKAYFVLVELGSHPWDAFMVKDLERYAQYKET
jgi:Heterokaryon incompatibility protein (HET)